MPKLADLLADIRIKTEQGKLAWETSGADAYRVIFDETVGIIVSRRKVATGLGTVTLRYLFSVLDNKGEVIESIAGEEPHSIFEAARRSALKIDERIDILKRKLDSL